jgi:alpha-glucosidase
MLSDNPTIEKECTDFITKVPVTFDETVPLDSKIAEYVSVARRKDNTWYIGTMTNWTPRDLVLDLSFLPKGRYKAEIFSDGMNSDKNATDFKKEVRVVSSGEKLKVRLAGGGGWVARLEKVD